MYTREMQTVHQIHGELSASCISKLTTRSLRALGTGEKNKAGSYIVIFRSGMKFSWDGEEGFLATIFTSKELFLAMHLVYGSLCTTYPDALEVGIHVIDDGFGACIESQNIDASASQMFSDWAESVPWFAVTRVSNVRSPWFFRLVWPLMRRLTTSPMPNSVPRGRTLEDLMVVETLEQLHQHVDVKCLPLSLEGCGVAYGEPGCMVEKQLPVSWC